MRIRVPPSGPFLQQPSFAEPAAAVLPGPTATLDASKGPAQAITLNGNVTLTLTGLPGTDATWLQLAVTQGAGGNKTLAIAGAKTPGGAGLTLSTAAGSVDIVSIFTDATGVYAMVTGLAFA